MEIIFASLVSFTIGCIITEAYFGSIHEKQIKEIFKNLNNEK